MGKRDDPAYGCWKAMNARCRNPKNASWRYYGGKGVTVCDRWSDFAAFLADVGPRPSPGHSLDRYPDAGGNYEPGNVRWATAKQQQERRGEAEGCKKALYGSPFVSLKTFYKRIRAGWSAHRANFTPGRV